MASPLEIKYVLSLRSGLGLWPQIKILIQLRVIDKAVLVHEYSEVTLQGDVVTTIIRHPGPLTGLVPLRSISTVADLSNAQRAFGYGVEAPFLVQLRKVHGVVIE